MRTARLAAWLVLAIGLASLGYAGLNGNVGVHLVLVIPVISAKGPYAAIGGLATILGLAGLFWTSLPNGSGPGPARQRRPPNREGSGPHRESTEQTSQETSTSGGGVILIGPIPIAFGSDRSALGWVLALAVLLTILAIVWTLLLR